MEHGDDNILFDQRPAGYDDLDQYWSTVLSKRPIQVYAVVGRQTETKCCTRSNTFKNLQYVEEAINIWLVVVPVNFIELCSKSPVVWARYPHAV